MRRLMVLVLLSLTILTGCYVTSDKVNELCIGMTKEQVIEVLGRPTSVSAKADVEYLNYRFFDDVREPPYFVRLVNGKVESYGRLGDFDSTKPPETKSTIELNIQK